MQEEHRKRKIKEKEGRWSDCSPPLELNLKKIKHPDWRSQKPLLRVSHFPGWGREGEEVGNKSLSEKP